MNFRRPSHSARSTIQANKTRYDSGVRRSRRRRRHRRCLSLSLFMLKCPVYALCCCCLCLPFTFTFACPCSLLLLTVLPPEAPGRGNRGIMRGLGDLVGLSSSASTEDESRRS